MPGNNNDLEKRLWDAADELRANSNLTSHEYSTPVLGLIFLRFADARFQAVHRQLLAEQVESTRRRQRGLTKENYQEKGALYLPEAARFSTLVNLPEGENIGQAINDAMKAIEADNPDLKGILPKTYNRLSNSVLVELLKNFNAIPMDIEGDVFGKIYEYFLGNFAMSEGQRGGEFFTATSIVKLIVEILEPYHGMVFDPACGSGGMFVQSADFVRRHRSDPASEISIYGQEQVNNTVRLCKMNLAVHGLAGDIKQGNSYYDDNHNSVEKFDFVMANPPFNVNKIDKDRIKDDTRRFPFGMPNSDNGNYIWIQLFYSALKENGRAGFVMANSAADARHSEQEIRRQLIENGVVDVMVAVGSNFFYNVTLPVTLWFLDKSKTKSGTPRQDTVLFLDARSVYHQVDRAHRDFTENQLGLLAGIVRLYRGEDTNGYTFSAEDLELSQPTLDALAALFEAKQYADIPGLCKVSTRADIKTQEWSLNPGRYVGVGNYEKQEYDFFDELQQLNREFISLNNEAHNLEEIIQDNVFKLNNFYIKA